MFYMYTTNRQSKFEKKINLVSPTKVDAAAAQVQEGRESQLRFQSFLIDSTSNFLSPSSPYTNPDFCSLN